MQAPVLVLNTNTKRQSGHEAQLSNITAAKAVSDIIRTTLGPNSMLKMILDPLGGITITNDGNSILREIDVSHPSAKSLIELSRTQDEEVGDGTTSVIIFTGEILHNLEGILKNRIHPRTIVHSLMHILEDSLNFLSTLSIPVDLKNRDMLLDIVQSSIGTKFISRFGDPIMMCNMAIDAVMSVRIEGQSGMKDEIDIKRYVRIEKVPGGYLDQSVLFDGVMVEKDVTHPRMRRYIENPRIILLDCPLEFKKGESQTNAEITKGMDWNKLLLVEEESIKEMCDKIISFKPDIVMTEKGICDMAQHFLLSANISCIRRLRKTDNNRIARAVGASIIYDVDDLKEEYVGKDCGVFKIEKMVDEYFMYLVKCKNPKACTILLRGGSKDILNEIDRNLQDAMMVVRNIILDPRVVYGGGSVEIAVGQKLIEKSRTIQTIEQRIYQRIADSLEVIPRTLLDNCGSDTIRILTELRSLHAQGKHNYGVDGNKGNCVDMSTLRLYEPLVVKTQTLKTSFECASMLLRIDDIVSGIHKNKDQQSGPVTQNIEDME